MVQDMCSILCRCIVVSQGLGACLASAWGLVHFSDDLMVGHVWVIRCANARAARAYPIHSEFNPILIHVRVIKAIATQSKTGLFYERVANVLLRLWHSMAFSCTVILSTHSLGGCQETWLVTGGNLKQHATESWQQDIFQAPLAHWVKKYLAILYRLIASLHMEPTWSPRCIIHHNSTYKRKQQASNGFKMWPEE